MRRPLIRHPSLPCAPVSAITVEILRPSPTRLTLAFTLVGDVAALRIPPAAEPARTDNLWKHTCFEAFLRPAGGEAYVEFNLSPSTRWAAYRFDRFREGMADATTIAPPAIAFHATAEGLVLTADLDLAGAPDLAGTFRLALSAVIETSDGALSFWALAHPPAGPDFHHPDCLALELTAPGPQ